jgi:hypothetical protein
LREKEQIQIDARLEEFKMQDTLEMQNILVMVWLNFDGRMDGEFISLKNH